MRRTAAHALSAHCGQFARLCGEMCFLPRTCRGKKQTGSYFAAAAAKLCEVPVTVNAPLRVCGTGRFLLLCGKILVQHFQLGKVGADTVDLKVLLMPLAQQSHDIPRLRQIQRAEDGLTPVVDLL